MPTQFQIDAATAVVTGASRGIGAATAVALARHGVRRIGIHYGGYAEGAEQTLAAVREAGADGVLFGADLTTGDGVRELTTQVRAELPDVDILVNNAGSLLRRAPLAEAGEDVYDAVMTLNVKAPWLLAQAVAPGMVARRRGAIVNLSSIAARTGGGPGATLYAAAKAAVATMTKGLAKELAPQGVRVNAVSPGTVDNHFHEVFSTAEMLAGVRAQTPLGRLARNEEIAAVIAFLCSDAASYVVGQTIELNGGMFMP